MKKMFSLFKVIICRIYGYFSGWEVIGGGGGGGGGGGREKKKKKFINYNCIIII